MIRAIAAVILLSISLVSFGQGFYYFGKAELAQWLLQRAWQKTTSQGTDIRPWPWADIHPAAKLEVPRLNIQQIVLAEQHSEALAFGPGLVHTPNNAKVLAGHRDSHFQFLENIILNDSLSLEITQGSKTTFVVSDIRIIDSTDAPLFFPPDDTLILVTCYPFDSWDQSSPLRYVVTASPQEKMPQPSSSPSSSAVLF